MSSRHLRILLLISVAASAALLASATASADTIYTYGFLESLPCIPSSCSGNVGLSGTISVNQLSTLSSDNFVAWNFSIVHASSSVTLTQGSSDLQFAGAPVLTATASELTIGLNKAGDGFAFSGSTVPVGQWFYGGSNAAAQLLNISGMVGFQTFSWPTTFTATRLSDTLTPEPAAVLLVGIGIAFLFVRRRSL